LLWPGVKNKIFYFLTPTPTNANFPCIPQLERIMPKGTIRNPGTKKTTAKIARDRKAKAASEWDLYRGAGQFGRETSGKGMSFTPSLPKTPKRTIRPATSAKKGAK
jgi:hypothetical protein